MKKITIIMLAIIIIGFSARATPALASGAPSVGVKKGDWIEYSMKITGPPVDALRNITWYRCDVLEVDGTSFLVNKTALMINGTLQSSVWQFNLTMGQVFGWVIIPANLSTGDAFFDVMKSANITIEGEEQKTLLGTTRTVTHANIIGMVDKEWDKATGVYVHAVEHTTDYTIITNAVATNMWNPQTQDQNSSALTQLTVITALLASLFLLSLFIIRKKPQK